MGKKKFDENAFHQTFLMKNLIKINFYVSKPN